MTSIELIRSCLKLAEFSGIHIVRCDPDIVYIDVENRARENLRLNQETGQVTLSTWSESGHNGDPYNYREGPLTDEESLKALEGLRLLLEGKALDNEERLLEAESKKAQLAEARARLRSRIGMY